MKRRILLLVAIVAAFLLSFNSVKKIMTFRTTSSEVKEAEARLEKLRKENEALRQEYELKKTDKFAEEEIRNKLGLAREGETIVVVPRQAESDSLEESSKKNEGSNFNKWINLFFGG